MGPPKSQCKFQSPNPKHLGIIKNLILDFAHWSIGYYLIIGACLPAGRQGIWLFACHCPPFFRKKILTSNGSTGSGKTICVLRLHQVMVFLKDGLSLW